jgi:hypothetical protein
VTTLTKAVFLAITSSFLFAGMARPQIGLRGIALAGFALGISQIAGSAGESGLAISLLSLGLGTGSMLWDIFSASDSARKSNEELKKRHPQIGLMPVRGGSGFGISLSACF